MISCSNDLLELEADDRESDLEMSQVSQYDLESEAILDWAAHEDNKMQIKYYDAATCKDKSNPIEFYLGLTSNTGAGKEEE